MKKYHRAANTVIAVSFVLLSFALSTFAQQIPEEARRYMVRGIAAIEMAKGQADYILALQEFEQAAKLAPDYPDVHYNLGKVQSKLNDFPSAIKSFQRYLELAPKSPEAPKVREEIYKLEYRMDRQKVTAALTGKWIGPNRKTFQVTLDGSRIQIKRDEQQGEDDFITIKAAGSTHAGPMTDVPLMFLGVVFGEKISGQYIYPGGKYSGYCELPERKGNFQGTIDADGGLMRLVYDRVQFEYELKFKSFLSAEMVCRQTNRHEQPGYVLELKRDKPGADGKK